MAEDDILYSEKWIIRQSKSLWDNGRNFLNLSGFKVRNQRKNNYDNELVRILEENNIPFRARL